MEPPSSLALPGRLAGGGEASFAVLVAERRWRRMVPGAEAVVRRAVRVAGGLAGGAVVLEGDGAVRRLNARHRGRNKATNVLTFGHGGGTGDIVLAYGVVRREAREAGRIAAHHLAHLVVHAVLHLDGYDHARAGEARRMERREALLLSRMGVPNPWKTRPLVSAW